MKQNHSKPTAWGYGPNFDDIDWGSQLKVDKSPTETKLTAYHGCKACRTHRPEVRFRDRIPAFLKRVLSDLFLLAGRMP